MLDAIMYIIAAGILPVLINKTTEWFKFDWIHVHIRPLWMIVFSIFTMYFIHRSEIAGIIMAHFKKSNISPIFQYIIIAFIGAIIFCAYWWFIGTIFKERRETFQSTETNKQNTPKLELKIIAMAVTSIYIHSTRLQLTVQVVNHGQLTTAHRWQLLVKTSTGDWKAKYMPGQQPIKGSINVPPLDEVFRNPLGTNTEVVGFLYFLLPQISHSTAVERLKDDLTATLSLAVLDSINHEWIAERNTSEMSKERLEHRPDK